MNIIVLLALVGIKREIPELLDLYLCIVHHARISDLEFDIRGKVQVLCLSSANPSRKTIDLKAFPQYHIPSKKKHKPILL